MSNKPRYICRQCGKIHKHFDDWIRCCNGINTKNPENIN